MKKFNNQNGFSLAEMMVTAGIVGVLGLAAYTSLRSSQKVVSKTIVSSEVSNLKNLLITNMSNVETCQTNFAGKPVANTYTKLDRKFGMGDNFSTLPFIEVGKVYGGQGGALTVTGITTSQSPTESHIMILKVDYQIRDTLKRAGKLNSDSFSSEIVIAKSGVNVSNCYTDISRLIKKAVELSCKPSIDVGNNKPNAVWNPNAGDYGECHHHTIRMVNSATGVVAPVTVANVIERTCPAGEFLAAVDTTPGSISGVNTTKGVVTYTCKKINLPAGGGCGAGQYMKGIDATTGNAICGNAIQEVAQATASGKAVTTLGTTSYRSIDLNCPGANMVLQSVDGSGNPQCVTRTYSGTCPNPGEYVQSVNTDGTVNCATFPGSATCGGGTYARGINAQAQITICADLSFPANCTGNQVMVGIDSAGNGVCVDNI